MSRASSGSSNNSSSNYNNSNTISIQTQTDLFNDLKNFSNDEYEIRIVKKYNYVFKNFHPMASSIDNTILLNLPFSEKELKDVEEQVPMNNLNMDYHLNSKELNPVRLNLNVISNLINQYEILKQYFLFYRNLKKNCSLYPRIDNYEKMEFLLKREMNIIKESIKLHSSIIVTLLKNEMKILEKELDITECQFLFFENKQLTNTIINALKDKMSKCYNGYNIRKGNGSFKFIPPDPEKLFQWYNEILFPFIKEKYEKTKWISSMPTSYLIENIENNLKLSLFKL